MVRSIICKGDPRSIGATPWAASDPDSCQHNCRRRAAEKLEKPIANGSCRIGVKKRTIEHAVGLGQGCYSVTEAVAQRGYVGYVATKVRAQWIAQGKGTRDGVNARRDGTIENGEGIAGVGVCDWGRARWRCTGYAQEQDKSDNSEES